MILILGGGLAGLSTAYHLGDEPHLVLEAESEPGGLCRSRELEGFTFDFTGHLLHLRDPRAIGLVDELMPDAFRVVRRESFVRTRGVTLPFPFQANLHGLPPELVAECVIGFVESLQVPVPDDPKVSFHDWSVAVLGRGISDAFMFPYNSKVFCRDPSRMTADWVSWAVPRPDLRAVVRGALGIHNRDMGYNPLFRYPHRGGIQVVPDAFAARVENLRVGARVAEVDLDRRRVTLAGGERLDWDRLIVTVPLPAFLSMLRGGSEDWPSLAGRLDWSVVASLNLGVNRPGVGNGAHWVYTPDPDVPFYRVGFPTNFSNGVAPDGTSSIFVEFALPKGAPLDRVSTAEAAVEALRREGMLRDDDRLMVKDWVVIDPGYVIFDRDRQEVMDRVVPALERENVHLVGRYGAWTYSYMERAILDGLELAERLRTRKLRGRCG